MVEVRVEAPAFAPGRGLAVRWCVMGAGLTAEGVALTVGFDSPAASVGDHWWIRVEAAAPDLMRIVVAFFGALFLLLAPRLRTALAEWRRCAAEYRWQPWLLLHSLGFAALYMFLAWSGLGNGGSRVAGSSGALALCCGSGLAVAVAAFWFLAMAPPQYWRSFFARERITLLVAFAAATAAWLGSEIAQTFWRPLSSATFIVAEWLLRLVYADVIADPSQLLLGTHGFRVQIAPQCSGYEGIALIITFLAVYLWLFRARIRVAHAFVLFPIGVTAVWLINVLRIVCLIVIGTSFSRQLSAAAFHSQAGWIGFIAVALAIVAVTHRMRFFEIRRSQVARHETNPTAKALLVPFLVLVGSLILTKALSDGFDRFYPARVLVVAGALLTFLPRYRAWDWRWSWLSAGIGVAVFLIWLALDGAAPGEPTTEVAIAGLGGGERAIWLGFRVVGSVVVVPLVEEMAFRGYLLRRLTAAEFEGEAAKRFNWIAFVLSSVAFGLLHGRWMAATGAGMAFALAQYRRGQLADAVVAHITTNGLIALLALMTGDWRLWS